jgi:hypothetical protein
MSETQMLDLSCRRAFSLIVCGTLAAMAAGGMTTQRLPETNHADEQAAP